MYLKQLTETISTLEIWNVIQTADLSNELTVSRNGIEARVICSIEPGADFNGSWHGSGSVSQELQQLVKRYDCCLFQITPEEDLLTDRLLQAVEIAAAERGEDVTWAGKKIKGLRLVSKMKRTNEPRVSKKAYKSLTNTIEFLSILFALLSVTIFTISYHYNHRIDRLEEYNRVLKMELEELIRQNKGS